MFFFFFQAEDGIRDIGVTGVQTCALPILQEPKLRNYVNGAWRASTATEFVEVINPATAEVLTRTPLSKIGRASCRERGEISVVAVSLKKKKKKYMCGKS